MRAYTTLSLIAAAMLLASSAKATCDCSILPTLGPAADFAVLGLEDTEIKMDKSVSFVSNANIGLAEDGELEMKDDASVDGYARHHPGVKIKLKDSAEIQGGVASQDMTLIAQAVLDAAAGFEALSPTQSFGKIDKTLTITGNGCVNVIEVDGHLKMGSKKSLTLKGGPNDFFVLNIDGDLELKGPGAVTLSGVNPDRVVFNITKASKKIDLKETDPKGTFLNPRGEMKLEKNGTGRGVFYAHKKIEIKGSGTYHSVPFTVCDSSVCPCHDPRDSGTNIQTPSTPPGRSRGNSTFLYGYFDTATYEGHLESYKVKPDGSLEDESSNDPIDAVTKLFKDTRDAFWDAGVRLRSNTSRKIYTTKAGARVDFDTNIDATDLGIDAGSIPSYPNYPASGVDTLPELEDAIVDYVHGQDAFDADGDGNQTELRSAVLGDIFHSNILFIGSPTTILAHEPAYDGFLAAYKTRDRVAYVGANDAMLHAFDAGAYWDQNNPSVWNDGSGDELFGYVPGLMLPQASLTPKTVDANGDRLVPGFVDGNLVAADAWLGADSGSKTASEWATVLVAAFREGGEGYLALDVTAPGASVGDHSPYPKFLWEFSHADLGESWSRPVITRLKLEAASGGDDCGPADGDGDCQERWVAIFGGGMSMSGDPNHIDYVDDPLSPTWEDKSKAIFIVALDDGSVLAKVKFDALDIVFPSTMKSAMKYSMPSSPGVLDLNHDGFADVVYIGDLGGQVWKWDVSAVGVDSDADSLIDNWPSGRIFNAPPVDMGSGEYHYRSFYHPPTAAYVNGVLHVAFGSGEEEDILYQGDPSKDDENRFYVIQDLNPTGASAFSTLITEADLTDVTSVATYVNPGNLGYFFKGAEGEKFITDTVIFAGHVLAGSYLPETAPTCGPGTARFYAFALSNATGFFDDNATPEVADRSMNVGTGVPSNPRVSTSSDPTNDVVILTTSEGEFIEVEPPLRDPPESSFLYWRQRF